jgi:hypothetical protein
MWALLLRCGGFGRRRRLWREVRIGAGGTEVRIGAGGRECTEVAPSVFPGRRQALVYEKPTAMCQRFGRSG